MQSNHKKNNKTQVGCFFQLCHWVDQS